VVFLYASRILQYKIISLRYRYRTYGCGEYYYSVIWAPDSLKFSCDAMILISLNLRLGGGIRTQSILDYIINHSPDLLVLGEFKDNENGQKIKETLHSKGYFFESSDDDLLGVLVASTHPFSIIRKQRRLVEIELSDYDLNVVGVYVPTGSKDKRFKDAVWQKIIKYAEESRSIASVITGDFNSCTIDDSMNHTEFNGKDLKELLSFGWVDSWAHYKNGESERYTWYSNHGNGFRFDYAFISPELKRRVTLLNVYHDTKARKNGLSDHSPLLMEINFSA